MDRAANENDHIVRAEFKGRPVSCGADPENEKWNNGSDSHGGDLSRGKNLIHVIRGMIQLNLSLGLIVSGHVLYLAYEYGRKPPGRLVMLYFASRQCLFEIPDGLLRDRIAHDINPFQRFELQ